MESKTEIAAYLYFLFFEHFLCLAIQFLCCHFAGIIIKGINPNAKHRDDVFFVRIKWSRKCGDR